MSDAVNKIETEEAPLDDKWSLKDALWAVGVFIVIAALGAGGFLLYESTKPPMVTEGVSAPDFEYPLLNGGTARLSDYRGKVVLINVWNTNCVECKKEMPLMELEYQKLKGQDFEILAVSTDEKGGEVINPFIDNLFYDTGGKVSLTFPILMDTENEVGSTYQTVKYPETFIVDKNGVVTKIIIGRLTQDDFMLISHMVKST